MMDSLGNRYDEPSIWRTPGSWKYAAEFRFKLLAQLYVERL